MKEAMIYRLRITRRSPVAIYPTFQIHDAELFYFPTKEAAEEKIRGFGWEPDLYCFIIEACPYDRDVSDKAYRRWVYDDDGDFISETLCSELFKPGTDEQEELLPGRRPDQCRFKTGDVVEILRGLSVEIGIVLKQPPTPEDIMKYDKVYAEGEAPNLTAQDYEEDAYIVLRGKTDLHKWNQYAESHYHAYVTNVLPCCIEIPPKLKADLKKLLEDVQFELDEIGFDSDILKPKHTGLDRQVIIRTKKTTDTPVVFYVTGGSYAITVSIDREPKRIRGFMASVTSEEIAKVKEWIKLNYDALINNWNDPDSVKLYESLKRI